MIGVEPINNYNGGIIPTIIAFILFVIILYYFGKITKKDREEFKNDDYIIKRLKKK